MRHGHSQSLNVQSTRSGSMDDEDPCSSSFSGGAQDPPQEKKKIGFSWSKNDSAIRSRYIPGEPNPIPFPKDKEIELMKERFAKLLLGEDMSGGGKGVSSALALSNAITNLAASAFAELKKLEPLLPEQRIRWKREIDWLLSVTDYIVEFAPSQQTAKDGTSMEIMTTKQRSDLQMNIPALKKLDNMLMECLDNFKDQNEFYYVSKDSEEAEKGTAREDDNKWWLPTVKVPPSGLSEGMKRWILFQKDSVNQVLKAAMAINAQVLTEMQIPDNYMEALPKNGRSSLGDAIYKSITDDYFDPEQFLLSMDLTTEHKIVDLKNRMEASIVIWRRKMTSKDSKSPWGSSVSLEKRELFEERAETILLILKQRFPGISQSTLDISKIQFNRDVGHSILESYSRILETLAHRVLSQIEDVLYADSEAQDDSVDQDDLAPQQQKRNRMVCVTTSASTKFPDAKEEIEKLNAIGTPPSMTLKDFMGLNADNTDSDATKMVTVSSVEGEEEEEEEESGDDPKVLVKIKAESMRQSYTDNLGGTRSPTDRH